MSTLLKCSDGAALCSLNGGQRNIIGSICDLSMYECPSSPTTTYHDCKEYIELLEPDRYDDSLPDVGFAIDKLGPDTIILRAFHIKMGVECGLVDESYTASFQISYDNLEKWALHILLGGVPDPPRRWTKHPGVRGRNPASEPRL